MSYTTTMTFDQIEASIPKLAKRGTQFRTDIQKIILSLARQWKNTGNVQPVVRLMSRIINEVEGYYGQALADYAMGMWKMTWDQKAKSLVYSVTTLDEDTIKQMGKEPWWEFSPPKEVKSFDAFAEIEKLFAKNAKKVTNHKDDDKVLPPHVVNAMRKAMHEALGSQEQAMQQSS